MIALSIIAVCLIAAAAALGVRLSPSLRSADQRGDVTLQTLLIAGFALLVLLQVASTLVIVLTDDDGGSSTSQQAAAVPPATNPPSAAAPDPIGGAASTTSTTAADPDSAPTTRAPVVPEPGDDACQPWEIFDPDTEAAGFGGPEGLGGVWSSLVGCVRVCYAQTWWGGLTRVGHFPPYRFIRASTPEELRGVPLYDAEGNLRRSPLYAILLVYSLTDIRLAPEEGQSDQYANHQIVSSTQAGSNLDTAQNAELGELITVAAPEVEEIRVAESGDACQLIQKDTGTELVNSDFSRTLRQPDDTAS